MGAVQFSLFFKQAPVFRWGERMFHPPGWAGGKSDSHRQAQARGIVGFYGTVLRRRDWRRIATGSSMDPACSL